MMAMGARKVALDEARDTLINVNALGDPVPSARFMGGRAFSTLIPDANGRGIRRDGGAGCRRTVDAVALGARRLRSIPACKRALDL